VFSGSTLWPPDVSSALPYEAISSRHRRSLLAIEASEGTGRTIPIEPSKAAEIREPYPAPWAAHRLYPWACYRVGKYALSLKLDDPGFDASVLSEFRGRLLEGGSERLLFEHLLDRFREMGLVKARGKQRTDSTRILAVVRGLNRLELVGETMRHALDVLSAVAPEWLQEHVRPEWTQRYVCRLDDEKLPKSKEARLQEGERIGADGHELLDGLLSEDAPRWLREVPAVETLQRVWVQNFVHDQKGNVRWRTAEEGIPPSRDFLGSPIDLDCRYARKFTTSWVGYRVHITETCEEDLPNIITDVQSTPATVANGDATPLIHETLKDRGLLPETQFVDTGYLDAELLAESKKNYGGRSLRPYQAGLQVASSREDRL
jgi:transposase